MYEKAIKDLTKDFQEKIEKLKNDEKEIKEKLENEVTKVKEKLENFLSEANYQINLCEKISKGINRFDKEEKKIIKVLSYISKINQNKKSMNLLLNESIRSMKFSYIKEKNYINYEETNININKKYFLKKIGNASYEMDAGKHTYGRILFDETKDKVYFIDCTNNTKISLYKDYNNLKIKKSDELIELPHNISVNYSVIHKGYFYYFKYTTNNIVKYDLNQKKVLIDKTILPDAILGNTQNQWGGYNDINLISDENNLYAVYASNNNNKRISIALIDENSLEVIKTWNTDSLEKGKCGPIFMIKGILYHIKKYDNQNDSVIYSFDLEKGKSSKINIPFENKGGYDSSLTYYSHINCLMTVNNNKIYKYNVILESENQ